MGDGDTEDFPGGGCGEGRIGCVDKTWGQLTVEGRESREWRQKKNIKAGGETHAIDPRREL
jgi:hypothetical protein